MLLRSKSNVSRINKKSKVSRCNAFECNQNSLFPRFVIYICRRGRVLQNICINDTTNIPAARSSFPAPASPTVLVQGSETRNNQIFERKKKQIDIDNILYIINFDFFVSALKTVCDGVCSYISYWNWKSEQTFSQSNAHISP